MRNMMIGFLLCLAAPALAQDAGAPKACFSNLCGMDTACWCHEAGTERRCWSTPADCDVDRTCCVSTKSCKSTPYLAEICGKRTSDARKKRDAAPKPPVEAKSYDLGMTGRPWVCSALPPSDLSRVVRVYCTDAEGQLVTMKVEHVEKRIAK